MKDGNQSRYASDEDILTLYNRRDEQAIAATQSKYGSYCRAVADRILRVREDAEECVNDTWLRAWNHIPPDRPHSMAAYLGTIVRNLSINRWRARRNRALTVDLDELRETIPMTEEDAGELPGLLGAFLARCDSLDRRLFVGRYWYARPVRDMALAYGLTPNTVSQRLRRTRLELKQFLEERGYRI